MIKIRPIDEELKCLHEPLAVTLSEDDNDSALDGFRVTNSGSVMIPSGLTKPYIERATNAANATSMYNQLSPQLHQDHYIQHNRHSPNIQQQQQDYFYQQQHQQQLLQMQQLQFHQGYFSNSLPRSFSHHSAGFPGAMPSSLPSSLPQYYSHQSFSPPPHLPPPAMSPMGMSPMGMAYSPMVHYQHPHSQQFSNNGYNYPQQYPYPYPNAW
mmetsp:Transcript_80082/g.157038  ORF Transcript_80082/g.157038 Transcript_80082/m.157038 type:complete len:211 (-) Transcript_80082:50-682(-)